MAKHIHIHIGKKKTKDLDPRAVLVKIESKCDLLQARAQRYFKAEDFAKLEQIDKDLYQLMTRY